MARLFVFSSVRIPSRVKWLNKYMGGKWIYKGWRGWQCDDGRIVQYTAPPVDEWDNPCGVSQCWLYTPNKPPVPFFWQKQPTQVEGEK